MRQVDTVRLFKNGLLKELSRTMFPSEDAYLEALDFWAAEGWEERQYD